jgi:anti-sigma factor RsiW
MNCREVAELLLEYVGGELAPDAHTRLELHLEKCPPCAHFTASYRLTVTLTRRLPRAELSPEAAARLRAALEAAQRGV